MKQLILTVSLIVMGFGSAIAQAQDNIATLREDVPINKTDEPAKMANVVDSSTRPARQFPMQPPLIPHKITNYQIDKNANKCMACHSRSRVGESQAIMISVTHYMDREGNFLASVSPRRYFCTQCHVVQTDAAPIVSNDFIDIDHLLKKSQ